MRHYCHQSRCHQHPAARRHRTDTGGALGFPRQTGHQTMLSGGSTIAPRTPLEVRIQGSCEAGLHCTI